MNPSQYLDCQYVHQYEASRPSLLHSFMVFLEQSGKQSLQLFFTFTGCPCIGRMYQVLRLALFLHSTFLLPFWVLPSSLTDANFWRGYVLCSATPPHRLDPCWDSIPPRMMGTALTSLHFPTLVSFHLVSSALLSLTALWYPMGSLRFPVPACDTSTCEKAQMCRRNSHC